MEICFENKSSNYCSEIFRHTKRCIESAESVVPDVSDDIGKVLSVQSCVLLKSKDVTGRGVSIAGEALASILYITELGESISFMRLTKPFTIEYDVEGISADTCAQIDLAIINSETRIINPRKISVTFEIKGELSCFRQEGIVTESILSEQCRDMLHTKHESAEMMLCTCATEKTFTVSEQFIFPDGKPTPDRIIYEQAKFIINENQLIGTKLITKGSMNISVLYLSDEVCYPVKAEFSTPFSQIADIGSEDMEICTAHAEISSAYYTISENINGDKLFDAEVHAVLQLAARSRKTVSYISDAYCNRMPVQLEAAERKYESICDKTTLKLSGDEKLELFEDCDEFLGVFTGPVCVQQEQGKFTAAITLDMLCKTNEGLLTSVQRKIMLESETQAKQMTVSEARLTDLFLRPSGQLLDAHITIELYCYELKTLEINSIEKIVLCEDEAYDLGIYPSVTLVKANGNDLWRLAKEYHSDIESIKRVNKDIALDGSAFLLIPKVI